MENVTKDLYGPGTFVDTAFTPVPEECKRLLRVFASKVPGLADDDALIDGVEFEGDDLPCIPGPIKSQAVTATLHAMFGIVGHQILRLRGIETNNITHINTNHAGMYPATPALTVIDGHKGHDVLKMKTVPTWDRARGGTPLLDRSFGIYPTASKDVWYQVHGSTNPRPVLKLLGIDPEADCPSHDEAYQRIKEKVVKYQAAELEYLMMQHGQAGEIVHSPKAWLETMTGKSLARHPLVNYSQQQQCPDIAPATFASTAKNDQHPLAGIKVLELARIIAAPAAGAALASMGAEIIRVNTDKLLDYTPAQVCSLMAGKTTIKLDLDKDEDRKRLWELVEQADVFLQAYRLRSIERRGFGLDKLLEMACRRGRGIVYIDENCYGPDGYYAERPGWQQTADAAAGSSYIMGRAFGKPAGQGVLPSLPISDMSTGILTALTTMCALRDRAKYGGSYHGHAALTAYNMATLTEDVPLYQMSVVEEIQKKYGFEKWSSDAGVGPLYYAIADAWARSSSLGSDERYYCHFTNGPFGKDHRVLGPVVKYDDPAITPRWKKPPVPFCHHGFRHFSSE